jgi:hypothetical protein
MKKIKDFIFKHPMFIFYAVCVIINGTAGKYGEPSLNKVLLSLAVFGLVLPDLKKRGILK